MKLKAILLMSVIYCMVCGSAWGLPSEKSGLIYYPKDGASLIAIHNAVVASGNPAHYKLTYSGSGVSTPYYITSGVTFEDYETFECEPYAYLVAASGVTVRYGRAPIASMQCFDGPGVILPIASTDVVTHIDTTWYGLDGDGLNAADNAAAETDSGELYIPGRKYYTDDTISFEATTILCDGAVEIIHALSDEPAVIFNTNLKKLTGFMRARQDALPSTAQTNASAFRFRDIIHADIDYLYADICYNGFENIVEGLGGPEKSWGNRIGKARCSWYVNSGIYWDNDGTGAHTGNVWNAVYISGLGYGTVYNEVQEPIYLNQCSAWVINNLNLEWNILTPTGEAFIKLQNSCSLNIGEMRFEGNESIYAGIDSVFWGSCGSTGRINITIGSLSLTSNNQTSPSTYLAFFRQASSQTNGGMTIGSLGGTAASSTVVTFPLAYVFTDSKFRITLTNPIRWEEYFTSVLAPGAAPSVGPVPVFMFGNQTVCTHPFIAGTSGITTFNVGGSDSFRVYSAPSTVNITDIEATPRYAQGGSPDELENIRTVILDNATSGDMIVSNAGNIDLTQVSSGTTILWTEDMLGNYVFNTDTFYVTTYN